MKNRAIVITVFLFIIGITAKADKANWTLGFGYNLATITQKSTKLVIDRYNQTRPWLVKKMGYLRPSTGFVYSLGWDGGAYSFEIAVNNYHATSKASGVAPRTGTQGSRELRLKSTAISLAGLWDFADHFDNNTDYGLGIKMGFTMGGGEYQTRINSAPFEMVTNTHFSNFDMFLGIFYEKPFFGGDTDEGFAVQVMPYSHGFFGLAKRNMQPLLNEIDPVNASANPLPAGNKFSFHRHFGLQVKLLYRIDR